MEEDPKFRRVRAATFPASEVEQITGVPGNILRDWRRRDLIGTTPGRGWKRLGTDGLIRVLVTRLLSERNVAAGFARILSFAAILPILSELFAEAYPDENMELLEGNSVKYKVIPRGALERRYLIYCDYESPKGGESFTDCVASIDQYINDHKDLRPNIRLYVYLVVDLLDVYSRLIERRIKPYFVDLDK
jgi:hypothetical protein